MLGREGYANKALGWLWDGASWLKTLVGLQPLATWEPVQLLYNNFAVIFGLVYVHLPFMVLPLYSALDRLDKSLIEASLDLGAGHLRTLLQDRRAAGRAGDHRGRHDHVRSRRWAPI